MILALLIASAASLLSLVIAPSTEPLLRFLVGSGTILSVFGAAVAARWPKRSWVTGMAIAIISILILTSGVLPVITDIAVRHNGERGTINDSVPQMEAAVHLLLAGKNPYRESFHGTVLDTWDNSFLNGQPNPIFDHLIMPPGHVLASTVAAIIAGRLFGFYDERMLVLAAYLVFITLASRIGRTTAERLRSMALGGLNPLLLPFVLAGTSDMPVVAALLATLIALHHKRWTLAAVLGGFAASLKLFTWAFIPALLVYFVAHQPGERWTNRFQASLRPLFIGSLIILILFLPFLIWDAPALVEDLFLFPTGHSATSYPIMGIGLGGQLLSLHAIMESATFPFAAIGIPAVLLFLFLTLPLLARRPAVSTLLLIGTGTLFLTLYFNRYFHPSHAAILLVLLTVAFAWWLAYEQPTTAHQSIDR